MEVYRKQQIKTELTQETYLNAVEEKEKQRVDSAGNRRIRNDKETAGI